MNLSLNKILFSLLAVIILAIVYTAKPSAHKTAVTISGSDEEICATIQDPSTLPYVSYNTPSGFDECVARCVNSAMLQVCPQLPEHSNVYTTQPQVRQQMLEGCTEHIKRFIINNTRCPYVKCEP